MKLTDRSVQKLALPAGESGKIFFDSDLPGFGYRLRDDGGPTWIYQFKRGGRTRRVALGRASAMSATSARQEAEKLYARVRLSDDPVATISTGKALAADAFAAAAKEYLEWQQTRKRRNGTVGIKPRSLREVERHLLVHAKPLHRMPLRKITRADITKCVTSIHKNSGARAGNCVRSSLSAMFRWAIENGRADLNPVIGSPKEMESSRDRVLLPAELRTIWAALDNDQYSSIIKLLLLTMQRENEIAALRRSELHDGVIILPAERTKNSRPHVVPLSNAARQIIEAQPLRSTDRRLRDLIFGFADGPFSGWSRSKTNLDAKIAKAKGKPLAHWTLHDLRRTAATYISGGLPAHLLNKLSPHDKKLGEGLRVSPHVREAVLNHVSGYRAGIAGVYDQSTYEEEKREALDKWALRVLEIVEGSNVTPLRRPA
jgi:integrase